MHPKLTDLISRMQTAAEPNWIAYREEICGLSDELGDEPDRVAMLILYKSLMDTVEHHNPPIVNDLAGFQKARLEEYRRFLAQEAMSGDQIDPSKLHHVTAREVAAGRLAESDELRELGLIGGTFLKPTPPPPPPRKSGWLLRLLGR